MTTETPMAIEINCTTGEEIIRPLTEDEIAERNIAAQAYEAQKTEADAIAAANAIAKESAQSKLAALGLTAEEIAAITK
jgi:hypothetical protein